MSDPVNWPPPRRPFRAQVPPPTGRSGRSRWLILIIIAVVVLFSGARTWLTYYVDALWFGSLGYLPVFSRSLSLQWTAFVIFGAATFLLLYGSFRALKKTQLTALPTSHTIFIGGQPVKLPVEPVIRFIAT